MSGSHICDKYHQDFNDPNGDITLRDEAGGLYRVSSYFLAKHSLVFKDMIDTATASTAPIDVELSPALLQRCLVIAHTPPRMLELPNYFLSTVIDGALLTYKGLSHLYCFVDKFGCEPIRPLVTKALCSSEPRFRLSETFQLAIRLDDFPLVCSAIRLMDFGAFRYESIWTALKPTWHSAFIRCILDETALKGSQMDCKGYIGPLFRPGAHVDKRVEEFKRFVVMYTDRALQM